MARERSRPRYPCPPGHTHAIQQVLFRSGLHTPPGLMAFLGRAKAPSLAVGAISSPIACLVIPVTVMALNPVP